MKIRIADNFDAILGFDFLLEVGATVDFDRMEMRRKASQP